MGDGERGKTRETRKMGKTRKTRRQTPPCPPWTEPGQKWTGFSFTRREARTSFVTRYRVED
uniref:hypothetical protein n=1 Tax=Hassallia byssoidea TaxID=482630 RepID=UPI001F4506F3